MKKNLRRSIIVSLLLVMVSLLPILPVSADEIEDTPTNTKQMTITHTLPAKDTPVLIFEVHYYGELQITYDWPVVVGAACTAAIFNFWSKDTLTNQEQISNGSLGNLWVRRCLNGNGNHTLNINTTVLSDQELPVKIYLELDTDQSFTGVIQDPISITFEFYPFVGQELDTNNVGFSSGLIIISFTAIVLSISVIFRKIRIRK